MKQGSAIFEVDVAGKEAVEELQQRKSAGNHHLEDIVAGVCKDATASRAAGGVSAGGFEIKRALKEGSGGPVEIEKVTLIVFGMARVKESRQVEVKPGGSEVKLNDGRSGGGDGCLQVLELSFEKLADGRASGIVCQPHRVVLVAVEMLRDSITKFLDPETSLKFVRKLVADVLVGHRLQRPVVDGLRRLAVPSRHAVVRSDRVIEDRVVAEPYL
jgi:hypothetical protein